jgi:hypothetical protein
MSAPRTVMPATGTRQQGGVPESGLACANDRMERVLANAPVLMVGRTRERS